MEDTIVSFETAKKLKEIGFNISCRNFYGIFDKLHKNYHIDRNNQENNEYCCVAPTQSLAQKYLRELHNIDVWVAPFFDSSQSNQYCPIVYKDKIDLTESEFEGTYEEALEAGLIEGLDLIAIK